MKLRSLLPLAAFAALVLTGCSKDDVVAPNQEPTVTEGYATFKINLPSTPGSRAEEYTDEGSTEEYAVKSIKFLIFEQVNGTGDINYKEAITVTDDNNWIAGSEPTQSTNKTIVTKIGKINSENKYYVVVLINGNSVVLPTESTKSYSSWISNKQVETSFNIGPASGFTMSNVVFSDGSTVGNGLVELANTKIGRTETEAQTKGPAATIYVERVHAKVEVKSSTSWEYNVTVTEGTDLGTDRTDKVTITGWALDNTNMNGFPIMNPADVAYSSSSVFLGFQVGTNYRLAWCKDPNYTGEYTATSEFNQIDLSTWNEVSSKTIDYCLENTMDKNNMKKDRATRVVFKASYQVGGAAAATIVKLKNNKTIYTIEQAKAYVKTTTETALTITGVTVAEQPISKGGYTTLKELVKITKNGGDELTDAEYDQVAQAMGLTNATTAGIAYYLNGEVYYTAYIKHLDIDDSAADKTGKYGVVRNNWYELTVNSISAIGEPTRPGTGDDPSNPDPIDEEYSYLNVSINILKWAKRTQNVDL